MRRLSVAALVAVILVIPAGSSARSEMGRVYVSITGTGGVKLAVGSAGASEFVVNCTTGFCPGNTPYGSGDRVTMTALPAKGWMFVAWHGACSGGKPICAIDLGHLPVDAYREHVARVAAVFVVAIAGLSRSQPVQLGTAANIADGWRLRIVSVTRSAHLSPSPPTGTQYFVAKVEATYVGGGAGDLAQLFNNLLVVGSDNTPYNTTAARCPGFGPSPNFPAVGHLPSGATASGNVCWTIASRDAPTLQLRIGPGFTHSSWFALH